MAMTRLSYSSGLSIAARAEEIHKESEEESHAPAVATVFNDMWIRQEAPDGRVYFFNRATGVSQWHIPNDLYVSTAWKDRKQLRAHLRQDFVVKMPGSARAMLDVDCMTQIVGKGVPDPIRQMQENLLKRLTVMQDMRDHGRKPLMPRAMLNLTITRAEGLRDADFMPGRDKSDPYCVVHVVGKEETTTFKTKVIMDDLDPVWNHVQLVDEYEKGDILSIAVYDEDDLTNTLQNAQNIIDFELKEETLYAQLNADECLGKALLTEEDLAKAYEGEARYSLDDVLNTLTQPYIFLKAECVMGWPMLRGVPVPDAKDEIEFAMGSGYDVQLVERPHGGSKVVAWDVSHEKGGYCGNFIGAYAEDARILRRGDTILCGRQRHTVKKVDRKGTASKKNPNKLVVYVHLEEDITGNVKVGDTWTKVTKTPEQGFFEHRVILYFDVETSLVTEIPRFG